MQLSQRYRIRVEAFRMIQRHDVQGFPDLTVEEQHTELKMQWHTEVPNHLPGGLEVTPVILTAMGRILRSGHVNVYQATSNYSRLTAKAVARFEEQVLKPLEALNDAT